MSPRRIRIYYECLEQALFLVKPLVEQGLAARNAEIGIDLVRTRKPASLGAGPIHSFWRMNAPDILVSLVASERELPLFVLEFSEAVKTEDHELQRATVAAASMWSGIPAVKLSGERQSDLEHGGNEAFDPLVMARLFQEAGGLDGYFYQEWPSEAGTLVVQPEALTCPPLDRVPILEAVVRASCEVACGAGLEGATAAEIGRRVIDAAGRSSAIRTYRTQVAAAEADPGSLVRRVLEPQPHPTPPVENVRDRVHVDAAGTLYVKLNRFDHAGDPDRGVLVALSTGWNGRVIIVYRMARKRKVLRRPALLRAFDESVDAIGAFAGFAAEETCQPWFIDAVRNHARPSAWHDITDSVIASAKACARSTLMRALVCFADGMLIQCTRDDGVEWAGVTWQRSEALARFGPVRPAEVQPPVAVEPAQVPNEDEVTFVTAHRILRPHAVGVVGISYPGHQGGAAILHGDEGGRTRSRTYADIIAVVGGEAPYPLLVEAKGRLGAGLISDVAKLQRLRAEPGFRAGIASLLTSRGIHGWDGRRVGLAVAFGGAGALDPAGMDVDLIVRLPDRQRYEAAACGDVARALGAQPAGPTGLPVVHECR